MSSNKKVWEIWVPGNKKIEQITKELPDLTARFRCNDFIAIRATVCEVYDMEVLSPETQKWTKSTRLRWNQVGNWIRFDIDSQEYMKAYSEGMQKLIEFLRNNPKP